MNEKLIIELSDERLITPSGLSLVEQLLVRMDSGNNAAENPGILVEDGRRVILALGRSNI